MKNKVLIFRGQNNPADNEINEALKKENRRGWQVISARTEAITFGQRVNEDYGLMPLHIFYITTMLLEKKEERHA